jgi:hypothetical protein
MKHVLLLVAALAGLATAVAVAEDDPAPLRQNEDRIEVPGTFASVGAILASRGANAQDALHSRGALGLVTPEGALWSFVDNAKGHGVIVNRKLEGKDVRILGWKFPKTRFIEISKYQVKDGDEWVAYDYCKGCGWEPGDNHDTDLCEDCAEEEK